MGKIRTFNLDDGRFYVSIRPEMVKTIDTKARNLWILESSKMLMRRLECLQEALKMDPPDEQNLIALGYNKLEATGVLSACSVYNYKEVDLSRYEQQVREILVNLKDGIFDIETLPSEILSGGSASSPEPSSTQADTNQLTAIEDKEDIVKSLVEELDHDKIGANYQELLEVAESKGLTRDDCEECVNGLMTKGIIFEPTLGYLKSIEK
jgi:hypothetical protein